ncbi:MAG: TetR/AcrR family transcriptional regulator [Ethanoligenens sp.]
MEQLPDIQETIIQAATELIQASGGETIAVTTRAIADKAGVGNGLIHYYFHTKEHLLHLCVQRIIAEVVTAFRPPIEGKGIKSLKATLRAVGDFLAANPAVSRVSILDDLHAPAPQNNTFQTMRGLSQVLGETGQTEQERASCLFALTTVLQAAFLHKDMGRTFTGYDFNVKEERDAFLDGLVDCLAGGKICG